MLLEVAVATHREEETKLSKDAGKKSPWRSQPCSCAVCNRELVQSPPAAPSSSCSCSTLLQQHSSKSLVNGPLQSPSCIEDKLFVLTTRNGFAPLSLVINVCNLDLWLKLCSGIGQCYKGCYCHSKGCPGVESSADIEEHVLYCLDEYKGCHGSTPKLRALSLPASSMSLDYSNFAWH